MNTKLQGRRFLLPLIMVSIVAVSIMTTMAAVSLGRLHASLTSANLLQHAQSLANLVGPAMLPPVDQAWAQSFCEASAAGTNLRVTLMAADGTVLGDSAGDPRFIENHGQRPEFLAAMAGSPSVQRRTSATLSRDLYYAAAPIGQDGGKLGVLRIAMAVPDLVSSLRPFYVAAVLSAILVGLAAVYANYRLARRLSRPVSAMLVAVEAWARGELEHRLPAIQDSELARLPEVMNTMAGELRGRIASMDQARRELAVLLDGMAEAVLAVDNQLNIRIINATACELFGHKRRYLQAQIKRSLLQVSGQPGLEALAQACLERRETIKEELVLYGNDPRSFIAYASPVLWEDQPAGVVIVLNDITRLKQLEKIRRDFVANVSHELRTPITLIKGFVETLEAGALDKPEDARRFLSIIHRNTDRMSAVIQDLLALAQLESPERGELERQLVPVRSLCQAAVSQVIDKAKQRSMIIQIAAEAGLQARVNEGLLEQALINLLDNAVKYGRDASTILLQARQEADCLVFSVKDEGTGIPARALPRVFERFYRVDQARSRELGGTGLGLSIVKHIALAHGGDVAVDSREGQGSVFSIRLPVTADLPYM